MKIAMTADELKTLTEDLVDEGIKLNWLANEYDEDASDVFCIMNRALAVLGIDIVEHEDEDEDEDEEYDCDDDEEEDRVYRACQEYQRACQEYHRACQEYHRACQEYHHDEDKECDCDDDGEEDELPPDPFDAPVESLLVEIEGKKFLRKDDAEIILNYFATAIYIKCQDMTSSERHELVVGLWKQFGKDFGISGVLMDV